MFLLTDVDTFDVGNRILGSMVPNPKRNYLEHVIRPKPDLYGKYISHYIIRSTGFI